MKKVGQILTNVNYTAQPEFHHNNGFSLDQCEPTGGVEGRRECCGYYPERFPFNYQIGKRCCYDKVYDGNVEKCCSGGKIMETCDTF